MKFIATICGDEWSGMAIHESGEIFDDYGPWKFTTEADVRQQMTAWALQDWDADAKPEDIGIVHQIEE